MIHQLDTPSWKRILLVNVPEDAKDIVLNDIGDGSVLVFSSVIQDPLLCGGDMISLGGIKGKIIGLLSEVKEFDEYVEKYLMLDDDKGKPLTMGGYKLYNGEFWTTISSKDSFLSLLRRDGFVLEEPVKPDTKDYKYHDIGIEHNIAYRIDLKKYEQQLSKYINPSRTLLIEVN